MAPALAFRTKEVRRRNSHHRRRFPPRVFSPDFRNSVLHCRKAVCVGVFLVKLLIVLFCFVFGSVLSQPFSSSAEQRWLFEIPPFQNSLSIFFISFEYYYSNIPLNCFYVFLYFFSTVYVAFYFPINLCEGTFTALEMLFFSHCTKIREMWGRE